jgi:RNA polymerase sigma-70 factor (ECF subfamily)
MNEERDQRLVDACLKGNTKAFEEIVLNYQKPLYTAAYRIVEDQDEAEDVLQNAFIKAYENLGTYKKSYKLFSWLYRITLNEALNSLHGKKRFEGLSGDYQSGEKRGDEVVQENELSHALDSALRELKLDYRLVIILNHFHDRSYTEMSYILNIPVKTVKSRLFTARNMLRELLVHNR